MKSPFQVAPALELDSLTTSHPISVEVKDPKEIEAIFDSISYKKGAAIIHMLENIGKKHASKKYDQFVLNTSCFWVVQFYEIFLTKIMIRLI